MKNRLFVLVFLFGFSLLFADATVELFDTKYNVSLDGDVDGDGIMESYKVEKFAKSEFGDYYHLALYRGDKLLWRAPKVDDSSNPFTFGVWDDGVSMPDMLVDIDGDGRAELLTMPPCGDVAVIPVGVIRYDGKRAVNTDTYLIMDYNNSNHFSWIESQDYHSPMSNTNVGWATGFEKYDDNGTIKTYILYMQEGGNSQGCSALIRFVDGGAEVIRWLGMLDIANTNKLYTARISKKDLYNSRGHKLKKAIDILRQNRVNYYKNIKETEDTGIHRFRTLKQRVEMSSMDIEPIGMSMRELSRIIIEEHPLLHIRVYNSTLQVSVIREGRGGRR